MAILAFQKPDKVVMLESEASKIQASSGRIRERKSLYHR